MVILDERSVLQGLVTTTRVTSEPSDCAHRRSNRRRRQFGRGRTKIHQTTGCILDTMGSLVDPAYELIDPTPDVHALFCQFDARFFDGRLGACEVKWSPRMTTCAGICCYEVRSGLCSIRLSTPLLKLRPRKDLVETLLHEMIHAFLFVTVRDRDRDGHGPQFQWHMARINKEAGTRITIYHTFHAEVAVYKSHHWRCSGPCRERRPFFGWVKRASNRAPSKNDLWWAEHERTCGGTFAKVSEPAEYTEKREKAEKKKVEGEEKKRGGASSSSKKEVDADAKQPRIDSVFGGGARLGGDAESKAAVKASTGGGGGGQRLGDAEGKSAVKAAIGGGRQMLGADSKAAVKAETGGGGGQMLGGGAGGTSSEVKAGTSGGAGGMGRWLQGGASGTAVVKAATGGGPRLGGAGGTAVVKASTGGGGQMLGGGAGRSRLLDLYGSSFGGARSTVAKPNRSNNDENAVIEVIDLE